MKTLIIRKIHIEERRPFRQQAAFAVPCGADSLRLLRETRFVFHGIIPLFCFSLVPAKLLLLRHASARAASRCVTTRALLIVAGWSFSTYAKLPECTNFFFIFIRYFSYAIIRSRDREMDEYKILDVVLCCNALL